MSFTAEEQLLLTIKTLPKAPGIYQFLDKNEEVIYVGKAKDLKSRVSSYFAKYEWQSDKTKVLIRRINDVKVVLVNNETEALLLESNLIKNIKPRYNIMLRDDKRYPWLNITNEDFPKLQKVRIVVKDGSKYFGPYPKGNIMAEMLLLIRNLFKYRTCMLPLSIESIARKKYKACLDYQLHLCEAPCIGRQNSADYKATFTQIAQILGGNFQPLLADMKKKMMDLAKEERFEEAQQIKEKIILLDNYKDKTAIVSNKIHDIEIYTYESGDERIYFNALKIVNGCIISSYGTEVVAKTNETNEELFTIAIIQTRTKFNFHSEKIIVPKLLDLPLDYVCQIVPQRKDYEYYKLLQLSAHNALFEKSDRIKKATLIDPERFSNRLMIQMQTDLRLPQAPKHIECFDNSNIQGKFAVAACVVFRNGKPSKTEYKHFNIKTVEGPDDFSSMKEIIYRRYSRLQREEKPLPQLIVIDGGKGQLSAAMESLDALGLRDNINVIGIAKRLEEIFYPNDPYPLCLDKRSATLKVIQHIRDEAHRFGITFHRNKRSQGTIRSQLTDIDGIGTGLAQRLLLKFVSVERIRNATLSELEDCLPKAKAAAVFNHFALKD